eukprot:11188037-Lingulodinium_polyedra.AAC.1
MADGQLWRANAAEMSHDMPETRQQARLQPGLPHFAQGPRKDLRCPIVAGGKWAEPRLRPR